MFVATKLSGTAGGFDLEGGIYFLVKEGEGSPKT